MLEEQTGKSAPHLPEGGVYFVSTTITGIQKKKREKDYILIIYYKWSYFHLSNYIRGEHHYYWLLIVCGWWSEEIENQQ